MGRLDTKLRRTALGTLGLCALVLALPAGAASSYADSATDAVGSSTGAAAVALGVPDYAFVHDAGLGFGGTSSAVFGPGESTTLGFPAALRNIPGEDDLVVSAFVGGLGASDSALVEVAVSDDGVNFVLVGSFDTASGRTTYPFPPERNFESVKHFPVDFGGEDFVTHVRLTNTGGTAEGLRLDAVEGLHPVVGSQHAFELRLERYRDDNSERFLMRVKNLADVGGVAIRGYHFGKPPVTTPWLEETNHPLLSFDGDFICVEGCVGDADGLPGTSETTHAWSVDGVNEAPAGVGLDPGRRAAVARRYNFDIDTGMLAYLSGFEFTVTWVDGFSHTFDYDLDVLGQDERGALYQKYTYFSTTPSLSGPRPVDYYEFIQPGVVGDCNDGVDNDGDGLVDYPWDPGCESASDGGEVAGFLPCDDGVDNDGDGDTDLSDPGCRNVWGADEAPACNDGIDNDGTGGADLADPGCRAAWYWTESPQCNDGVDNDGDGAIDTADAQCVAAWDDAERPGGWCGLGFEVGVVLPALAALRRRTRRGARR